MSENFYQSTDYREEMLLKSVIDTHLKRNAGSSRRTWAGGGIAGAKHQPEAIDILFCIVCQIETQIAHALSGQHVWIATSLLSTYEP